MLSETIDRVKPRAVGFTQGLILLCNLQSGATSVDRPQSIDAAVVHYSHIPGVCSCVEQSQEMDFSERFADVIDVFL